MTASKEIVDKITLLAQQEYNNMIYKLEEFNYPVNLRLLIEICRALDAPYIKYSHETFEIRKTSITWFEILIKGSRILFCFRRDR